MKTNELRRGNLIERNYGNVTVKVLEVLTTRILYVNPDLRMKDITADLNGFRPITLTEEWLLRLGLSGGMKVGDSAQ